MRTYTDEEREQAAEICSIAANNPEGYCDNYRRVAEYLELDYDCPAMMLAYDAWQAVLDYQYENGVAIENMDAEAEALIRSGEL